MANNYLRGVLGFKGERGFSAYEIACKNGFVGSEKDWLSMLGTSSHFERKSEIHTATEGQTEFNLPEYYTSNSFIDVYVEGEHLDTTEYTITDDKIVLTNAVTEGTKVEIITITMSTNALPIVESIDENSTNDEVLGAKSLYNLLPINVKNFGAVGDGVTDDTEAIQKAIEYAETHGGVLFINEGLYKITDELNVTQSIKIIGSYEKGLVNSATSQTYGSHIKQENSDKNIFNFSTENYYGVEISQLRLSGGNRAINIDTTGVFSEFTFEKIHFNGGFKECIYFGTTGSIGRISDCDFSSNEIGINANKLTSVTISENNFWENSTCHIKLGTVTDVRVMNNWFEKVVESGCSLLFQAPFSVYKTIFLNNEFFSTKTPTIYLDGITNISDIAYIKATVFENCRFSIGQNDYAVVVRMTENDVTNTTNGNSNYVDFKNCIFANVKTSAIYSDYKWLYWNLNNCECYSSWNSGNVDFTSGSNAIITTNKEFGGYRTNGVLRFDEVVDSALMVDGVIYKSSGGTINLFKYGAGRQLLTALSGGTANRPTEKLTAGLMYYDTTIGKPIFYNGTMWVDATGTQV